MVMGTIEVRESHLQGHRVIRDHRNERALGETVTRNSQDNRVHRNKLSYGSGQKNHLDRQEFCEERKKDGFFTVPHLLSTALYSAS